MQRSLDKQPELWIRAGDESPTLLMREIAVTRHVGAAKRLHLRPHRRTLHLALSDGVVERSLKPAQRAVRCMLSLTPILFVAYLAEDYFIFRRAQSPRRARQFALPCAYGLGS